MTEFRLTEPGQLKKLPPGTHFVLFSEEVAPTAELLSDISDNHRLVRAILISKKHEQTLPQDFKSVLRPNLVVHSIPDSDEAKSRLEYRFENLRKRARSLPEEIREKHERELDSAISLFQANGRHAEAELLTVALRAINPEAKAEGFGFNLDAVERVHRATRAIDFLSRIDVRKILEAAIKPGHEADVAPSGLTVAHIGTGGEADFIPGYYQVRPAYLGTSLGYTNFNLFDEKRLHILQLLPSTTQRISKLTQMHPKSDLLGWRYVNLNLALVLAEAIGAEKLSVETKNLSEEAEEELVKYLKEGWTDEQEVIHPGPHDLAGIHPWRPVDEEGKIVRSKKDGQEVVRYEHSVSGHKILEQFGLKTIAPRRIVKKAGSRISKPKTSL